MKNKIDQLLQFILLTAGQEDEYSNRWLSPIHLIKYVYLADLAFARYNNGQNYTGLNWKFHHYGPWDSSCYQKIEPALRLIQAEKQRVESKYFDDDRDRWYASDDQLYQDLQAELPLPVAGIIAKSVHKFGSDTKKLLHHVYITKPMLVAAPGEFLDFTIEAEDDKKDTVTINDPVCKLTDRQMKRRKLIIKDIKGKYRKQLDELKKEQPQTAPAVKYTPPRYDEIYFRGMEDLDRIAGEKLEPGNYKAIFSDDVWKSKSRFDPELS